ncbi:hypothetical protein BGX28_002255, partial [Mortierella sp. GBA30]
MKQRKPDLYEEDSCQRCYDKGLTPENEDHLWDCPDSMKVQRDGWREEIEMVNVYGHYLWAREKKEWSKKMKEAKDKQHDFKTPAPKFSTWSAED